MTGALLLLLRERRRKRTAGSEARDGEKAEKGRAHPGENSQEKLVAAVKRYVNSILTQTRTLSGPPSCHRCARCGSVLPSIPDHTTCSAGGGTTRHSPRHTHHTQITLRVQTDASDVRCGPYNRHFNVRYLSKSNFSIATGTLSVRTRPYRMAYPLPYRSPSTSRRNRAP